MVRNRQRTFLNTFDQIKSEYRGKIGWCLQISHIKVKEMEVVGVGFKNLGGKIENMEEIWWCILYVPNIPPY